MESVLQTAQLTVTGIYPDWWVASELNTSTSTPMFNVTGVTVQHGENHPYEIGGGSGNRTLLVFRRTVYSREHLPECVTAN